jgi:RHS repeat-associated protein
MTVLAIRPGARGLPPRRWGYDAQYTDSDTGLVYLRARYYDPATSRFISIDPQVMQTREAYGYAGDDPMDKTDPTGKDSPSPEEIAFVNDYTKIRNAVERTMRGKTREDFAEVANYYYFAIKAQIAANDDNLSYLAFDKAQYQNGYKNLSERIYSEFAPLLKAETTSGWWGAITSFAGLARHIYHINVILRPFS